MEVLQNKRIADIAQSITRLTNLVDLTKSQYPYLPLTFSVWRKEKYQELKLTSENRDLERLTVEFHEEVDKKLLPNFLAKVKEGIKASFKALRAPSSNKLRQFQEQNEYESLIVEYIEAATGQLYRLEILGDLLTFPYGIPVTDSYYLRSEFSSHEEINNNGMIANLINKHSQTVVSKGLSALGSQVWSRIALLMIGGMNVLGFASGVVISQAVDLAFSRMSKNKRITKLQAEILQFNENSQKLQSCIRESNELMDKYIQSDSKQMKWQIEKQFKKQIQKVFVFDSEEIITVVELEQGWKFVDIKQEQEDEEFEMIEKEK